MSDSNDLIRVPCCVCRVRFGVPRWFDEAIREDSKTFYCPNGHSLVYNKNAKEEKKPAFSLLKFNKSPAKTEPENIPNANGESTDLKGDDAGEAS